MNAKVTRALCLASLFAAATSVAQTFQVVHDFVSAEGSDPQSGLVQLNDGSFCRHHGRWLWDSVQGMDTWGRFGTTLLLHRGVGRRKRAPHAALIHREPTRDSVRDDDEGHERLRRHLRVGMAPPTRKRSSPWFPRPTGLKGQGGMASCAGLPRLGWLKSRTKSSTA